MRSLAIQDEVKKERQMLKMEENEGEGEGETAGASRECGGSGDEEAMRVSTMKRHIEKEGSK